MFYIALWFAKLLTVAINIIDKKRGTNIAGQVACKICKGFISHFKNIDLDKVIFVTGTNGKSTTINMITHTFEVAGKSIATNIEGANMMGGVATTLVKNSTLTGKFKKEILLCEIDERSLAGIHKLLPAKNLCVTNLQKDQVQRNGEPDYIYQKIKPIIGEGMKIYLNNEEPRVKSFEDFGAEVIYYGMDKNEQSFTKDDFYDVTLPCPKCNDKIRFNYYNVDNIGNFECTNCEYKSEEDIKYFAKDINYDTCTFKCLDTEYTIAYNQPFFIYNFVLCIALCKQFGIEDDDLKEAFATFKNISGRLETIKFKSKEIKYIRIKQENPETLQTAFEYISRDKTPKVLMIGLEELIDFPPHYTNTFYAFDCDFKRLIESNIDRYICFSEAISYDTANSLVYAGISKDKISVLPCDNDEEILNELNKYDLDNVYLITWIKKYEELLESVKKYN